MEQYNKHAKLKYIIFGVLGFVCIILACAYMTQYCNLILIRSANGAIETGTKVGDISTNSIWNSYVTGSGASNVLPFLSGLSNTAKFQQTAIIIYNVFSSLQTVNNLILYLGIITLVAFAVCMIFSNGSRRIFYKSNLIVGLVCPAIVIIFTVVVAILNTLAIPDISNNLELFACMDVAVAESAMAAGNYSLDTIMSKTRVSIATPIIADVIFLVLIAYCVYLMIYAVKRYKECASDRNQILAKAENANE